MKVCLHKSDQKLDDKKIEIIISFVKLLQHEYPLNDDVKIFLLGKRKGKMTTGSRKPNHSLKILTDKRMMRDILRTIGHEWVHEFEDTILHIPHLKDIGGKNENIANAEAGKVVKKFEKKYPKLQDKLYE